MSKHDQLLNELVYQIDDIVYDFYAKSNEIISLKRNREGLMGFRDKALETLNDMNIRSLEIISGIKDKAVVEERVKILLEKNKNILSTTLEVIVTSPNRNEFIDDINTFASGTYESAKEVLKKVEASETFGKVKETVKKVEASQTMEKVKDITDKGIKQAAEGLHQIANDPRVVDGTKLVKEKSKEVLDTSSKLIKEGTQKVSEWIKTQQKECPPTSEGKDVEKDEVDEKSNNL